MAASSGRRKWIAGIAAGIGAAALVLSLDALGARAGGSTSGSGGAVEGGPLRAIEWRTYDWRLSRTAEAAGARSDVVLVDIDEYSLRNLEPNAGRWPWPRAVHSMVIDYLSRAPARAVVYDVNFAEPDRRSGFPFGGTAWSGAESDQALIESVRAAGNVILPVDASFEGDLSGAATPPSLRDQGFRPGGSGALERRVVFPPFPDLAAVASGFGHSLLVLDPDGPIRHTVPFVSSRDTAVPSLGLAAALRADGIPAQDVVLRDGDLWVRDRHLPLTSRTVGGETPVSYRWGLVAFRGAGTSGGANGAQTAHDAMKRPYARYAFFDLLVSEEQLLARQAPQIDPVIFKDKIVFVGVSASGLADTFTTPVTAGKMPGAQVHAAVADDILSGRFLCASSATLQIAAAGVGGIAAGLLAVMTPVWVAVSATLALVVAFWFVATEIFARGVWVNVTDPILSVSIALFGGVAYQYVVEGREKRRIKQLFGRYVSRDIFAQLVAHPELARLGGQRREMTVLFSDIRGFTTLTEQGAPEDVVGMLNEYFTRMVDVVFRHQGTVDKFVGDMVVALFGAPLDDPNHAAHAVDAALDMLVELEALNARWAKEGRFARLEIGIGVNTGPMIAGNIGSESIMSYTVIGDAVNLGSRLQSLNKEYGTHILASEATRAGLTSRYIFRALGDVVVKGKRQPVSVYEVVGRAPDSGSTDRRGV